MQVRVHSHLCELHEHTQCDLKECHGELVFTLSAHIPHLYVTLCRLDTHTVIQIVIYLLIKQCCMKIYNI